MERFCVSCFQVRPAEEIGGRMMDRQPGSNGWTGRKGLPRRGGFPGSPLQRLNIVTEREERVCLPEIVSPAGSYREQDSIWWKLRVIKTSGQKLCQPGKPVYTALQWSDLTMRKWLVILTVVLRSRLAKVMGNERKEIQYPLGSDQNPETWSGSWRHRGKDIIRAIREQEASQAVIRNQVRSRVKISDMEYLKAVDRVGLWCQITAHNLP